MPMTSAALSALIVTELGAKTGEGIAIQKDFADKLAKAIVDFLKANLTVTVPQGIPVSTAGSAAAQTGATTAPATGVIS